MIRLKATNQGGSSTESGLQVRFLSVYLINVCLSHNLAMEAEISSNSLNVFGFCKKQLAPNLYDELSSCERVDVVSMIVGICE